MEDWLVHLVQPALVRSGCAIDPGRSCLCEHILAGIDANSVKPRVTLAEEFNQAAGATCDIQDAQIPVG